MTSIGDFNLNYLGKEEVQERFNRYLKVKTQLAIKL